MGGGISGCVLIWFQNILLSRYVVFVVVASTRLSINIFGVVFWCGSTSNSVFKTFIYFGNVVFSLLNIKSCM